MGKLSDSDHVFLDADPVSQRYHLGSLATSELVKLPVGEFELLFEEGEGFVFRMEDGAGAIARVSRFLTREAHEDNDGNHIVRFPGGQEVPVSELKSYRVLLTLGLRVAPTDILVSLQFAQFKWPREGFKVFVSIADIHSYFKFSQYHQQSSVWVNHMWSSWQKLLLGKWDVLFSQAMQRSKAYQRKSLPTEKPEDSWQRTLPFFGCTLHALLCLLFGWSFRRPQDGGFEKGEDVERARVALRSFIAIISDFQLHLCKQAEWMFPWPRFPFCTGFRCTLPYTDGHLDIANLQSAADQKQDGAAKVLGLLQPVAHMPHLSLWDVISCIGARSKVIANSPLEHEVVMQILRQAAHAIEAVILATDLSESMELLPDSKVVVTSPSGVSREEHLQQMTQGHLAAARSAVERSWQETKGLTLCNDDSNVRSSELSNTALVLPSNEACWAPVQAICCPPLSFFS